MTTLEAVLPQSSGPSASGPSGSTDEHFRGILASLPSAEDNIPDEYVCPITHTVMTDPVIIESGVSYERQAIIGWFESGKNLCPMTNREVNTHVLISNIFLKNEIRKFLENGPDPDRRATSAVGDLPIIGPAGSSPKPLTRTPKSPGSLDATLAQEHRKRLSGGSFSELHVTARSQQNSFSDPAHKPADVRPLLQTLMLTQDKKVKKNAISELYQLSSEPEHVKEMVKADGLEPLKKLLTEHSNTLNLLAASTVANIAVVNDEMRGAVGRSGSVSLLVNMLNSGQSANRAAACAALKSLALTPSLKGVIGKGEAVKLLVKLLKDTGCRAKAAATLANLTTENAANCREVGAAPSAIDQLMKLLKVKEDGCMNYAAATLEHLADEPECRGRFTKAGAVKPLVLMMAGEDDDQKAVAACVLRYLCNDNDIAAKVEELGGITHLENMLRSDTFYNQAAALGTLRVLVNKGNVKEFLPNTTALPSLVKLLKHSSASITEGAAALLMELANACPPNQEKLAAAGVFPPLVHLVKNGVSTACKTYASAAINNLCANHAANKDRIIAAGCVPALIGLCAAQDAAVLPAVRCMLTLSSDHVPGKQAIAASGGLQTLVDLLKSRHGDGPVVMYTVLVLTQCALGCPNIQEMIADVGGIPALVDVLASVNLSTKFPASAALAALASSTPMNRRRIVAAGAVPLLVQVVQWGLHCPESTPHLSMRRSAASTLAYLALEHEHKQVIAEAGAIPVLVRWLASTKQLSATASAAAAAWYLSLHSEFNKQVLVKSGAIPLLNRLLTLEDTSVRMYAAGALVALESSDANLQAAVKSGALGMLINHYNTLMELDYAAKDTVAMTFKLVSGSETLRGEILKAGGARVLGDLLACGDEFCKAQASETIANLAADDAAHDVLVQARLAPLLVDMVRLGNIPCQRQALWALHTLACARLALGDERMVSQLTSCGAESTLKVAAQARDATVRQLATMILPHLGPEMRAMATGPMPSGPPSGPVGPLSVGPSVHSRSHSAATETSLPQV